MGRSSRSQAEDNRARIVEVASGLFRARGIEAVGIAEVMQAAGMTQGGFYRHFPTKDALAAEACAHAFERGVETWTRVAGAAESEGRDRVEAISAHYLSAKPPERTCPIIALGPEAARRPIGDPLRDTFERGVEALFDVFAGPAHEVRAAARPRFAQMVGAALLSRATGWTA